MRWTDVRTTYPDQWLIIEAVTAHSQEQHRVLDSIAVLETCADGAAAHRRYRALHREQPGRELYFVHTSHEVLEIEERPLTGFRARYATHPA